MKINRGMLRAIAIVALGLWGVTARAQDVSQLLQQNWTWNQQVAWYEASQGSRLVPLSWLQALELAGPGQQPFLSDEHIDALRYIPRTMATQPNMRLPLGFTIDYRDDENLSFTKLRWKDGQGRFERWVGMTCAACHTTKINYNGKSMTVDGGTTLADFQAFIEHLNDALRATRDEAPRFARFAKAVLGAEDNEPNRKMLKNALASLIGTQERLAKVNQTDLRYGFGRLDAVGNILNKIAFLASPDAKPNPSDAPVSYPFLWGTPQHDFIEWNLVAKNEKKLGLEIGALARNTGEIIGVFADVVPKKHPILLSGFVSSADVENLVGHEHLLKSLRPPKWPDSVFGAPDKAKVDEGRNLFATYCKDCHTPLSRTDVSPVKVNKSKINLPNGNFGPLGTDPWMACNAIQFKGPSGILKDMKDLDGVVLGDEAPLINMLGAVAREVLLGQKDVVIAAGVSGLLGYHPLPKPAPPPGAFPAPAAPPVVLSEKERRKRECASLPPAEQEKLLVYKGRPLNGIWATAPYLHNGSVPTLYDLLLPPGQRPPKFNVGTREFDPRNVGYIATPRPDSTFEFDTKKEGNSNAGHDYLPSGFTEDQRRALVEYMKTL
jgi:hypothetical protein